MKTKYKVMSKTIRAVDYAYSSFEDEEWKLKRDGKKAYKPNKKFKTLQKQSRKAKEKQALLKDPDLIPEFPKTDVWNYN